MKWLALGLTVLLLASQYRLWFAEEGSLAELHRLQQEIDHQEQRNAELEARNLRLEQEVIELQQGLETVEERARRDLGMIRDGETYYQLVESTPGAGVPQPAEGPQLVEPAEGSQLVESAEGSQLVQPAEGSQLVEKDDKAEDDGS